MFLDFEFSNSEDKTKKRVTLGNPSERTLVQFTLETLFLSGKLPVLNGI